MKYIINNSIIFNLDEKKIYNENETIELTLTATRLLNELIANKNISRDEILTRVWGKYGLTPSNNNLNKNISNLRRVFILLGDFSNVIETIPKEGFIFNGAIKIEGGGAKRDRLMFSLSIYNQMAIFAVFILSCFSYFIYERYSSSTSMSDFKHLRDINKCRLFIDGNAKKDNIYHFMKSDSWKGIEGGCLNTSYNIYYSDNGLVYSNPLSDVFIAKCNIGNEIYNECLNYVYQNK